MCSDVKIYLVSSGDPSSSSESHRVSTSTFTSAPAAATNITTITSSATIATATTTTTTGAPVPVSQPITTAIATNVSAADISQEHGLLSSAPFNSNSTLHDCTTLAPMAVAPPSSSGAPVTTGTEQPFSWAWISPRSSYDSLPKDINLGFVFQKPSREDVHRKAASVPKRRRSSSSRRLQQLRPISPDYRSMGSSSTPVYSPSTPDEGAAMLVDAAMPLDIDAVLAQMTQVSAMVPPTLQEPPPASSSPSSPPSVGTPSSDSIMHELGISNPNDLTALLGNLLSTSNSTSSSPVNKPPSSMDFQAGPTTASMVTSASSSLCSPPPLPPMPTPVSSTSKRCRGGCCGSFASSPTCQPGMSQGESVVITITPLPKLDQAASSERTTTTTTTTTTTRIVTCYCGPSCACPGCLVHPGNSFLGNQALDPYAGLVPSNQTTSCSSASSSCTSDDEERLGM